MVDAVVAGHICIDLIPALPRNSNVASGRLLEVGTLDVRPGGCVANTGGALAALGASVRLVADVGDDSLAELLTTSIAGSRVDTAGVRRIPGSTTSYSIVIEPPGVDRSFWHHPGANVGFDLDRIDVTSARVLHVGYPPLLPALFEDGGGRLERLFRRARDAGVATSLDMVAFDPTSAPGRVAWDALLARVLPVTDVFFPSLADLAVALRRDEPATVDEIRGLADEMIAAGAAVVALKAGERGIHLRTAGRKRIADAAPMVAARVDEWTDRELWAPARVVEVIGTTGAGDAAAAGFLAALLRDADPERCLRVAVAAGGARVSTTGPLAALDVLEQRLASGWAEHPSPVPAWPRRAGVATGPRDAAGANQR